MGAAGAEIVVVAAVPTGRLGVAGSTVGRAEAAEVLESDVGQQPGEQRLMDFHGIRLGRCVVARGTVMPSAVTVWRSWP